MKSSDPGPDDGVLAYRRSGVDVAANARAVELIREVARHASGPGVVEGIGGFAGLFDLGDGRLLVAGSDGVGTKMEVARSTGRFDTIGIDAVAMCANDVVCTGAEPLFFLDYLAVGRLVPDRVAAIVAGVAEGCRMAGCALLGGETAEHPGVLDLDQFDLVGFCIGIVERDRLLGPERVQPGDVLMGFRSTGLHANGFSLVRRVLLEEPGALDRYVPELGRTLGEELLQPTAIYTRPVIALARAGLIHSAAHVTGGGFHENVPRALPESMGADVDAAAWDPPPIFAVVAAAAGVEPAQLFGVLNMGIGLIAVVPASEADRALAVSREAGASAVVVGRVVDGEGVRLS